MTGDGRCERALEYRALREYLALLGGAEGGLAASLSAALERELTPRQRQMISLYYMEGRSMTEIAGLLGLNVSTVSRTVARGKMKLKRSLRYGSRTLLADD